MKTQEGSLMNGSSSSSHGRTVVVYSTLFAPASSLTGWSSRRPQAPLAGALRASHSGAAYRER